MSALAIRPCPEHEVETLAAALGLHRVTAETLVRRGFSDPAAATAFLEGAAPLHDPFGLGQMTAACEAIEAVIAAGGRIVVHGDYDCDGICATAVAVEGLRSLGADVGWHLPSRFAEGYGLAEATVDAIADDGAALLVTVDCGITAVAAAERARARGLPLIVTDHHRPGDALPDAIIVAARGPEGTYPFPDLCGTGVAFKLMQALVSRRGGGDPAGVPEELRPLLDLVALATVADVVPLVDENRSLVRAGMKTIARGRRPGLAMLMRTAQVDRARLRCSDLGFRLGPRLNAAGRLGHPERALALLMAPNEGEARPLADELEGLNRERQQVEDEILRAACRAVEASEPDVRAQRAIVVWGEGWHEGVVGIVASRLVERYGRPAIAIAVDGETAKGSGRSVGAFDLHAGLAACSAPLTRWGGHRAAAGLSLASCDLEGFAAAFRAHATETLSDGDLRRRHHVDAVCGLGDLTLDLARELQRLEPHGLGNPAPTLLVPGATLSDVSTMGEGKHMRLQVVQGRGRLGAVAFGRGSQAETLSQPGRYDVLGRLEVNEWNGAVSQRLTLRDALPLPGARSSEPWAHAPHRPGGDLVPLPAAPAADGGPKVIDRRGAGAALSTVSRLLASGEGLLVVCADVALRQAAFAGPLDPARFGRGEPVVLSSRDEPGALAARAEALDPDAVAVADGWSVARLAALRGALPHVVLLDPPGSPEERAALAALPASTTLHLVYGARELDLAGRALAALALRPTAAALWRALPEDGAEVDEEALLAGADLGTPPAPAWLCGRALEALAECGAIRSAEGRVARLPGTPGKLGETAAATRHAAWLAACEELLADARRRLDVPLAVAGGRPAAG